MSEHLRVEDSGSTRILTIDRPEARNALTREMRFELKDLMVAADEDPDVAVIVLTGADPAFSGGADIKEIRALNAAGDPRANQNSDPCSTIRGTSTPVIAAVNGPCVTGGLELALSCNLIVASDRAAFADTHARVGLVPSWGMSAMLPRAIGRRRAVELTLTGRFVTPDEALRIGLVNEVVVHEELMTRTLELATHIAAAPTDAIRAALALYRDSDGMTFADAFAFEVDTWRQWRAARSRPAE